jgi:hypothetical protein
MQACVWYYVTSHSLQYLDEDLSDADVKELYGNKEDHVVQYPGGAVYDYLLIWFPPLDWINFNDAVWFTEREQYADYFNKYLLFAYYSVLFLGQNEVGPVTESQLFGCTFMLLINIVVNANLFGDIAFTVSVLLRNATFQQMRSDQYNGVMNYIGLGEND